MSAYERGNAFERRVAGQLRDEGYMVWQTRGSKSATDLIAAKAGQLVLVQVKAGAEPISGAGWNALRTLAEYVGAVPVVADRSGRAIRYRRITGWHRPHSQHWPAEPFRTDELVP